MSRRPAKKLPPLPPTTCGYVGCGRPAIKAHRSKYGRHPWFGCPDHEGPMNKALFIGQPSDSGQVFTREVEQP